MFLGERNEVPQLSGLASVYYDNLNNDNSSSNNINDRNDGFLVSAGSPPRAIGPNGQLTPPSDFAIAGATVMGSRLSRGDGVAGGIRGWLEIWDYAGGSSFRGFVAEDASRETKSLFVFFDAHTNSRELKQALVALIELTEALDCSHMVICIDRSIPSNEARLLTKGLQWAGFSPTTLDFWSAGLDLVSNRWLFMGMEV
ncbi:hypothetical protein VTK26DRAFT_7162 [Humicola hyalothermophila]